MKSRGSVKGWKYMERHGMDKLLLPEYTHIRRLVEALLILGVL